MSEIKPPIHLSAGGGSGGAASRFGIEDATSDVSRNINMQSHGMSISHLNYIDITAGDYPTFGLINNSDYGVKLQNRRDGEGDVEFFIDASGKQMALNIDNYAPINASALINNGLYLQPSWQDYSPEANFLGRFTGTVIGHPEADVRVPVIYGIHYLPVSVNGQFADPVTGNITLADGGTGGGGGASRFGIEDTDGTVDRSITMTGHELTIDELLNFDVQAGDWNTGYSDFTLNSSPDDDTENLTGGGSVSLFCQSNRQNDFGGLSIDGMGGSSLKHYSESGKSVKMTLNGVNGFFLEHGNSPTRNQYQAIDRYIFKNTAAIADISDPANIITKTIVATRAEDDFPNDAAAAARIPVGGFYHTSGVVKMRLA